MKKLFFIFGSIFVFYFFSCTENESTGDSSKIINESKVSEVLKAKDYEVQKLMYYNLSPSEKLVVWNRKFEKLSSNDKMSNIQKKIVNELRENLIIDIFIEKNNNDKAEVFKNVFVKDFLKKANHYFSPDEVYNNFYLISSRLDSGLKSCSCNIGSTFTCGYGIQCRGSQCRSTSTGCGFLWVYECNGNCDVLQLGF